MEPSKKKKMMKMMLMMMMMKKMMMMMKEEEEIIQCKLLPSEIIKDILSRLPFESLVHCRCVCKTWRTLIEDPLFSELIHNHDDDDQPLSFIILTHPFRRFEPPRSQEPNELLYAEYKYKNGNGDGDEDEDEDEDEEEEVKRSCNNNSNSDIQLTRPLKLLYSLNYPVDQFSSSSSFSSDWVLIGSSNGLICLSQDYCGANTYNQSGHRLYYICNPFTGEYLNLISDYSNVPSVTNGFGYHPGTKQYKLVSIHYNRKGYYGTRYARYGDVKVYTLGGSGRWRDKGQIPFLFPAASQHSALVNGAIHWVTTGAWLGEIVSFDLADEEFRIVPLPPLDRYFKKKQEFLNSIQEFKLKKKEKEKEKKKEEEEEEGEEWFNKEKEEEEGEELNGRSPDFQIGALGGGCLYLAEYDDLWVMNMYMCKESWTKSLTIDPYFCGRKLLSVLGNGALLWQCLRNYNYSGSEDWKSGSMIKFYDKRMATGTDRSVYIFPYIKSFVSLKALGEQDVKYAIYSKQEEKRQKKTRGNKRKEKGNKRKRDASETDY